MKHILIISSKKIKNLEEINTYFPNSKLIQANSIKDSLYYIKLLYSYIKIIIIKINSEKHINQYKTITNNYSEKEIVFFSKSSQIKNLFFE